MESECHYRFLVLDFGHPMNNNSIDNIMNSLQDILTLALATSRREITFGISILNSDFAIFESESYLRRNYELITKGLKTALKVATSNSRVTVQEYKYLLSSSIEAVLRDFQKYMKVHNQSANSLIQIAVMTKKTASVLADILRDVTGKLQKNFPNMPPVKKYKIVQILNGEDNASVASDKDMSIDWASCLDDNYSLHCFFKEWLLNQQQQLRILLSRELNLEVHCDVEDCLINPGSIFDGRFGVFSVCGTGSHRNSSLGIQVWRPPRELEIINRFPASGFCPTFVFGIPRRVSATRSTTLKRTESEINSEMFKQLCRELHQTGEGLLARSALPAAAEELNEFHLLTSDGSMLLMNDVAPEELHLPTREGNPRPAHRSCQDESAASVIRTCFEKIKRLNEYNPKRYSSGIYDYVRNRLVRTGEGKSSFGHFDPRVKSSGKRCDKKEHPKTASESGSGENFACENRKKRPKTGSDVELERVHPALLSQDLVEKYRKIHSQAFNLPELSRDYNENLK